MGIEGYERSCYCREFFFSRGGIALEEKYAKRGIIQSSLRNADPRAGDYDSTAFQKKLDDLSITMRFSSDRDSFFGGIKTLSKNKDEAFNLLKLVLEAPRLMTVWVKQSTNYRRYRTEPENTGLACLAQFQCDIL